MGEITLFLFNNLLMLLKPYFDINHIYDPAITLTMRNEQNFLQKYRIIT